ncbi:NAD(P)/FAD-dependent oxidoreductase [Amycolatopsis sp. CA-230715]|uniref:NAD(P)/FAD-dependent oxidoreductase n=1 Tax=Amycolatopsis sp. CA-230715 TaxID=2745196 RepID=UPI001C00F9D8|nr:FAD-dependent oxidoreductase [Amycolatopsis sp. CA-230715]QWF81221.1 NADH dehydrogenase-like protein YjlD [Amycolatopsis sp. CA-230715]
MTAEKIVVVGAGYTGLAAAKLAAKWTGAEVTLVNASDRFVERVRLHQLASGQRLRDLPLRDLLAGTGARLVVGRVRAIDPDAREVLLDDGAPIGYDKLIYALGSHANLDGVPGAAEHAYTVASRADAERLRAKLSGSRTVAVVGGGLTGVEAAAELAEAHPGLKVSLVTGGPLGAALSERGTRHLHRVFGRLGVDVRENAKVIEVRADGLVLADGDTVEADTVVWTAGFVVSSIAAEAGFDVDAAGRMVVDEALRSVSHPDVIAIGDAAAIRLANGLELRMACATGLPTTQHAVRVLAGKATGSPRFRYFNQCISLGRRDALIQFVRADDSPVDAVLKGRIAAFYKEAVVRGTILFERHPVLPTSP